MKFYEKGDRPLEILTSRQWFIKTMDFREALLARGRELRWHPAYMQARLENWINGLDGRLVRQPAALLRRAVPACGIESARTGRPTTQRGCCLTTSSFRSIRRPTCRTATGRSSATLPGGFTGDPDVMDTWATSSLTPQIAGALGRGSRSLRARVPDGRATAGARHHPHVAVLDGAARRSSNTARCRGRTPQSPDGCSIPTARRCRSPRATSSRRWRCSRSTARTACATGRRAAGPAPTRRSTPAR